MKNSKKVIIPILIILIILIIAGGAFAYIYIETDILKTNKEIFFKYLSQIYEEDGFIDKRIQEFYDKKKQNPYENSGEIAVEVQNQDELNTDIIEKVNDLVIRFGGKTDSLNQKIEREIEIDYGNDVVFPINYRQDGEKYGIQINDLSKKFIAFRNENLDKIASNLGIEDNTKIPDQIELSEVTNELEFTTEEIEQLKQLYGNVLNEQLTDDNFSKAKVGKSESYTLELSNEQIKKIIVKILEATKQNTLIIDKINKFLISQNPDAEIIDVTAIDNMIEEINSEETQEVSLKITLVQSNKTLNQVMIEYGNNKITIGKNEAENNLNYNFDCVINVESEENDILENMSNTTECNLYLNVQYIGLENLNNIKENYEFGFGINNDEESIKYGYKINTDTIFVDNISIDEMDNSVAIFLNDYNETQLIPFLTQVGVKLVEINKTQMESLGLEELENPLLYSNPFTSLLVMMYNMSFETVDSVDF